MRFKRQEVTGLPTINLIPMIDVLMTVLTFFIIVSMTLNGQVVNVFLPRTGGTGTEAGEGKASTIAPLVIGLNAEGKILYDGRTITPEEMIQHMQAYLQQNPQGIVNLKADRELTYAQVAELLKIMRDVGGGRVSLGIESVNSGRGEPGIK